MKFAYINVKQTTLKCNFFYAIMSYNVFIHYDVVNNTFEEKMSIIKNRIKRIQNVHEALTKQ